MLPDAFAAQAAELRGRSMICRPARVLPVEVIVRGYLSGSGWKDYLRTGAVGGISLPAGLRESERLPEPIFTPSTKAEQGAHDENIDFAGAVTLIGAPMAERVRDLALALYRFGRDRAEAVGIILADTKFEFGTDAATGELLLIDEVLTPDSSRFWDAATYAPGGPQASYDKQFVRDWLEALRLGQDRARARAAGRCRGRHARPLRRGIRAHHWRRASSATSRRTASRE